MEDNLVHNNDLGYFSMSGTHIYMFTPRRCINTFPLNSKPGFIATSCGFDEYFVGVGKTRSSAIYDWKAKFHCYYQRFRKLGTKDDFDKALFNQMESILDLNVYDSNTTTVKEVHGVIASCRENNKCPCSYKLKGSQDIYQLPSYDVVDASMFLLNRGDKFKGIFEYRDMDYKLLRILYVEKEK